MARRARAIVCGYGACLELEASDETLLDHLVETLPRGWCVSGGPGRGDWRFLVRRESDCLVTTDGAGAETSFPDMSGARDALREELRRYVGFHTPDLFFVHAGAVAYHGAVIVLPGQSFAGKSTLVRALVDAGAEFYSDEYAIFDRHGRVMQYREPLIARGPDGRHETEIVAEGPDRPLPVALVAVTAYREGAVWNPRRASRADGIVALLEHVSRGRKRPAETLAALKLGLAGATVLVGERGDAGETAAALLQASVHLDGRLTPSHTA